MSKFAGWDRTYSGKPREEAELTAPYVKKWTSVFGDEVIVERYHEWEEDTPVYPTDIPDDKDKWILRINNEKEYFSKRVEAVEEARERIENMYPEEKVKEARRELREEN